MRAKSSLKQASTESNLALVASSIVGFAGERRGE